MARNSLLSLLATALVALPLAAQEGASPPPGPLPGVFTEIVDVRVVNLEVVVTDRAGVPVRGLGAGDFVLRVDGEEVPIDYFSEVLGGRAVAPPSGSEAVPGLREVAPGGRLGTSYLVFVDELFALPTDRNRVLRSLADTVGLGPEDLMAIVAFDGQRLEMLTTWTGSTEEVRRVLRRAEGRPAYGLQRLAERRQFDFDRLLELSDDVLAGAVDFDRGFRNYLEPRERFYVTQLAQQVERSVAAASATLRSFAMPPGRKVMLLLSGGWPLLPAEFLLNDPGRFVFDRDILQGQPLFRPLADTANLLGYTLYPVDVPGLDTDFGGAALAAQRTPAAGAGSPLGRSGFLREREVHASLEFLARETGGKALLNAGRTAAFETVVGDTRSFYWLGFTPQRDWDDRRHEVEVTVRDPELRVRARRGYLDSSRQREVSMAVESALLFGNPPAAELLKVSFGEPRRAGRGKVEVPLSVLVPVDELTFLPRDGAWTAQVELRLAVVDDDGGRSNIPVIPLLFELAESPEAGTYASYDTTLKVRRGPQRAVIAVHDVASGRIVSAGADLDF